MFTIIGIKGDIREDSIEPRKPIMKVGIDSYCYHRFFGEIYPDQTDPLVRWTLQDFVDRAVELGVDGVSLESCFLESLEPGYLSEIKGVLEQHALEGVLACV